MSNGTAPAGPPRRDISLRTRWNRAFALLTIIIVLSGVSSVVGARLLIGTFRDSAVRVEIEATVSTQLRADLVAYSIAITLPVPQHPQAEMLHAAIDRGFAMATPQESSARAKELLGDASTRWQALISAVGPVERRADAGSRGAAVAAEVPRVLALIDRAGTETRVAVRNELADAARLDRLTMAALISLQLMAIALAVRLAWRLSTDVLRPVGILRDSANHLARGDLNHRVVVNRVDELGELAVSFNAMADAIAGTQRGLQLEANTDSLTGLANRGAFHANLMTILSAPNLRGGTQAVLFVDLDDFKDVNDNLGHAAGDELLRIVSGRLNSAVRPGDLVARLGGDEFALLVDGVADPGAALTVAERVVAALAEPVDLGQHEAHVGASVGMAIRQATSTPDSLMREADIAMYAAKGKGKNRVERYEAGLVEAAVPRQAPRGEPVAAHDRKLVTD